MRKEVIGIGITICFIAIGIYIVKNFNTNSLKKYKKIFNSKFIIILNCIIFIFLFRYFYNSYIKIKDNIHSYLNNNNLEKEYAFYDTKIDEENKFYKSVINLNYENVMYNNPYILEGFNHVEGEWNNGFIIEDFNTNQYVWVPCINFDDNIIPKLEKSHFSNFELISKDYCYDTEYKDFLISALKNGGFYISRYEIGNKDNIPVSQKNVSIWNNITQDEAINIAHNMYQNDSFYSELINGYAYDTTLNWINNTNSIIEIGNYDQNSIINTGRDYSFNNIFDITDNILEITSEKNYDTVITRGMYNENIFDNYSDMIDSKSNRYSMLEETCNNYTGFRTILYKK